MSTSITHYTKQVLTMRDALFIRQWFVTRLICRQKNSTTLQAYDYENNLLPEISRAE